MTGTGMAGVQCQPETSSGVPHTVAASEASLYETDGQTITTNQQAQKNAPHSAALTCDRTVTSTACGSPCSARPLFSMLTSASGASSSTSMSLRPVSASWQSANGCPETGSWLGSQGVHSGKFWGGVMGQAS